MVYGYIYDKEIHRKSIQLINQYDNKILTEKDKVNLVDTLYSKENIQDTKFYHDFKDSLRILDNFVDDDSTKAKAQKMLRKIESVNVIPRDGLVQQAENEGKTVVEAFPGSEMAENYISLAENIMKICTGGE